jgi:hypothetical protein
MSETGALIRLGGAMPKPYSQDLRVRVVEAVVGGASRREVAELYGISPSVVVIWIRRWNETGRIAAKSSGGSVSPLDEHAEFLLGLIVEQPDMTLDEIVAACRESESRAAAPRCGGSTSAMTSALKKTLYAAEQKRADVIRARRRWMREQGMFDPARLVFIDETWTNTAMVRLRGRNLNQSLSAPRIPAGKTFAEGRDGAAFFGDTGRSRVTETGLSRVRGGKAVGSQRLFPHRQETAFARNCVVGLVGLKPATNRLWAPT